MDKQVAVAHYCEGSGHATRMMGIVQVLEARGVEPVLAGGGPGTRFLRLNGYDPVEPATVEFIADYQFGNAWKTPRNLFRAAKRTRDFSRWLKTVQPTTLLTDDMYAAMAAMRRRVPFYFLKHDASGIYNDLPTRTATRAINRVMAANAETFFYPTVWNNGTYDPEYVSRIPPIAHDPEPDETVDDLDVLLVPSAYSSSLDGAAAALTEHGYETVQVGADEWEPVPSLMPYVRGADYVVCSGYSTVMEAAVAGTSCIITPATSEQRGVARLINQSDIPGFTVVDPEDCADQLLETITRTASPDPFENGADHVAEHIVNHI